MAFVWPAGVFTSAPRDDPSKGVLRLRRFQAGGAMETSWFRHGGDRRQARMSSPTKILD